jgi:hypothetical protein
MSIKINEKIHSLSVIQKKICNVICDHYLETNQCPGYNLIASRVDKSKPTVKFHIGHMIRKGILRHKWKIDPKTLKHVKYGYRMAEPMKDLYLRGVRFDDID